MIAKVHWHSHAISAALQDPHKNVLIVFGSHSAAEHSFRMAIDGLAKNLPDYPCLINRQGMTITMAEGGRIQFRVLALTSDCRAIEGRTFHNAIYDESWHVPDSLTRSYIRTVVSSRIR